MQMRSGAVVRAFDLVKDCSRSVLLSIVHWIALKIFSCHCKGNLLYGFYGPLPSMLLLLTDCLNFVRLQTDPGVLCSLLEFAVEFSSCPSQVILPSFLLDHFVQIRHWDRRTELISRAGELSEDFGWQLLDHCDRSFLICFG